MTEPRLVALCVAYLVVAVFRSIYLHDSANVSDSQSVARAAFWPIAAVRALAIAFWTELSACWGAKP